MFFDLGETLVNEDRMWAGWARWIGLEPSTVSDLLQAAIERGEHHRDVFARIRPGFDWEAEAEARARAADPETWTKEDLYPDAIPCLQVLRAQGYLVAAAGNQPASFGAIVAALDLPLDLYVTAADLGAEKPAPDFFARLAARAGVLPGEAAYVGDRVDNDVVPAKQAGMLSVFIRRGPWARVQSAWPEASAADLTVDSLLDLPALLSALRAS